MSLALVQKSEVPAEDGLRLNRVVDLCFHLLLLAAALVVGVLVQVFGPSWVRAIFSNVRMDSLSGIVGLLAALLISVIAHELGHLFAALFLNYKLLGGAFGPFRFEWWRHKAFFRLQEGNWSRCSVSVVPREIHNLWRARMLWVVGAGPGASLLVAVVAAGIALRNAGFIGFWSSCAEVNFFLFVLGLVPNGRSAKARNDAALFRSIWRNDADAEDLYASHRAAELTLRRIRPNDYPADVLRDLTSFPGRPHTNLLIARRMREWAADNDNRDEADKWDKTVVSISEQCGPRYANIALAESACFDVMLRRDFRSAVHKFARVDFEDLFPPSLAERAWAARLVACGLPHRAPAHILRAQYDLPLGDPYYNYERMLLDTLHKEALAQSQPRRLLQA